jgi:hypothetical protein
VEDDCPPSSHFALLRYLPATITNLWAPVVCIVSVKGNMIEGERAGRYFSLERYPVPCFYPSYTFITSCNNFAPLPSENVYNGHTDNELVIDRRPKEHCAHE